MSLARLALLHERFIGAVVFDGLWLRLRLGGSMFALGLSLEFAQAREHVLHGVAAAARMTQLLHGGGHEGMLDVKRRKRGDFEQLLRRRERGGDGRAERLLLPQELVFPRSLQQEV